MQCVPPRCQLDYPLHSGSTLHCATSRRDAPPGNAVHRDSSIRVRQPYVPWSRTRRPTAQSTHRPSRRAIPPATDPSDPELCDSPAHSFLTRAKPCRHACPVLADCPLCPPDYPRHAFVSRPRPTFPPYIWPPTTYLRCASPANRHACPRSNPAPDPPPRELTRLTVPTLINQPSPPPVADYPSPTPQSD